MAANNSMPACAGRALLQFDYHNDSVPSIPQGLPVLRGSNPHDVAARHTASA
jgi:hypothetical protein